ncbi:hypothetical protein ACFS4T_20580 [Pseudomonas lini]
MPTSPSTDQTLPTSRPSFSTTGGVRFYVDCTSSAAVAAWFASHKYSEATTLELCEDCDEVAVMVRKRMARYAPVIGTGHLYVLSKQAANHVGLVNLATLTVEGYRPRTVAQSAWLLGPLHNPIPQNCYLAQITVPSDVLQAYAAARGLTDTNTLFPSPADDPILRSLLGLPWEEIKFEASLKKICLRSSEHWSFRSTIQA